MDTTRERTSELGERDTPGVIAPPPLIFLAGLGLGFLLEALLPDVPIASGLRWIVGGLLLAGGLALQGSFVMKFRAAGTPVPPFRPTTALVTTGPYRLTRNPGYLGMALISAGIGLMASALWVLIGVALAIVVVDRFVIAREERYLESKFPESYPAYKSSVRRWI
jgi:protein-S-isoprenylcysteine O-methyltransferase Ste14